MAGGRRRRAACPGAPAIPGEVDRRRGVARDPQAHVGGWIIDSSPMRPIVDVAASLGIPRQHLTLFGDDKGKVALAALDSGRPRGKLILVSAITPTDAGEGKTTISIGLAQGLSRIGKEACLALREPSLGPTFGMKGGATGGGLARIVPEADINLHFTGDFHAVSAAHNLLAALLDNHIQHGDALGIDPRRVFWRRVIDMNDRSLRHVVIGLGGAMEGVPRETGFDITPASEVMAALCLAEDAEDLRARLSRIVVALTREKNSVTAANLNAVGSMMVLLKDALKPNLVQSLEGVPALVHGGPFANIAHGGGLRFRPRRREVLRHQVRLGRPRHGGRRPRRHGQGVEAARRCFEGRPDSPRSEGRGAGPSEPGEARREHPDLRGGTGRRSQPVRCRHGRGDRRRQTRMRAA